MSTTKQKDAPLTRSYRPEGYQARPLHIVLTLTDLLGRIPPPLLTPAWLALAAIACWPWGQLRIYAGLMSLALILIDGISLALLPRLGRSFGPVTPPLLALTVTRTVLSLTAGLLWPTWPALLVTAGLHLAIAAASLYATWVEPFRIVVTRAECRSPKLHAGAPLRLLHISDLHVERLTPRDRRLVDLVRDLAPDVIVLTGDYLNLSYVYDAQAQAEARDLLAHVCDVAAGPIYAITGSPPVDPPEVVPGAFKGLPITWLLDRVEELDVKGQKIRLAGLRCSRERSLDAPRLRRLLAGNPGQAFTLLLHHSPDLMPEAVELGVDLYLCGHTHGGQIRLPWFGAIITSSAFWKRYEMGRYEEGNTTLYVSRGLGLEGFGAPRARFLAPPEIVLWTLRAPEPASRQSACGSPRP